MAYLHSIFQDIADIISNNSDKDSLKLKLETHQFDWEKIVPVASSHLVIPLIYCKLKEKELLHLIPEDLKSYLEEITRQNSERNKTILKEVQEISTLLNENKIDHVFLKGAAMLASGIYTNIGERMIGDIDILVHPEQLFDAHELLKRNDYKGIVRNFRQKIIEHRHLARLIPNNKLAAVEIHRKLLRKSGKNQLEPIVVLNNKENANGILAPNHKDLLIHNILSFEINDYGYYYNFLGLRNAYDASILAEKVSYNDLKTFLTNKYMRSFLSKNSIYFNIPNNKVSISYSMFRKKFFLLKQRYKFIAGVTYRLFHLLQFCNIIGSRVTLFIRNKKYRKSTLNDRKRIIQLIRKKFKVFI
jgi:hypothetical protein